MLDQYVKNEYRGNGYSKILNNVILEESRRRNYKEIFLKTDLNNYCLPFCNKNNFEIIEFKEVEKGGTTGLGKMKHWQEKR